VRPTPSPDAALAAFFQDLDAVRDRRIFLCLSRCGLRGSEVCALTWDAIARDADTGRLTRGQEQVERRVSLSPEVKRGLAVWRAPQTPGASRFPSPQRHRAHLFRSQIHTRMDQYLAAAGLTRPAAPHCLRQTCAPHLRHAGVSLEVLKALRGPHSLSLTLRSAHIYDHPKKHPYETAMAQIAPPQAGSGRERWHAAPASNAVRPYGCGTLRRIPSRIMAGSCAGFSRRSPKPLVR
jgi:integrase